MTKLTEKRQWNEPTLIVFGTVDSLTLSTVNKTGGAGDGLTFNGTPIHYVSG